MKGKSKNSKKNIVFKKPLFFLIFCLMITSTIMSQTNKVTGRIVDKSGEPQMGSTVVIKNTTNGSVADVDGNYSIQAKKGDTLVFSNVGAKQQEIKVEEEGAVINITLVEDVTELGSVEIVAGYGKIKKRDLTGSIVSVVGDEIKSSPTSNPITALQGKVAGLYVTNSGGAGSSPNIKIRGVGTLNSGSNPLFVVDGMLLDNIDFVNTNDIQSVEVLKDPSSLAIFGVQGANGVIIITTSRAKKGTVRVKYDGYGGMQYLHDRDRLRLTNASNFTMLYNEQNMNEYEDSKNAAINSGQPLPMQPTEWVGDLLGDGTDWQSEILRPAAVTSHSVSVSRGDDRGSSLLSVGYYKQDGIVKYDSYRRLNGNLSGDYNVNKALKLGGNVNLSYWDSDPATGSVSGAAHALPTYSPYAPEEDWNDDNVGSLYTPSPSIQKDVGNPVATMEIKKGTSESYGYRSVGNIYAEISFLKDFTFKSTGYYDIGVSYGSNYNPIYNVNNSTSNSSQRNLVSSFSRNTSEYTKYQTDLILNYKKKIRDHNFGFMMGYTAHVKTGKGFRANTDSIQGNVPNLISDFWVLDGTVQKIGASDWFDQEAFISYISRVNYSYENKYLLNATFRADGSSKFSPSNRWGYFPSVGIGWIASEEEFFESLKNTINFLKVKASYGQLGNDKIGNYQYFRTINPHGQQVVVDGNVYYLPTVDGLVDKDIHWEVMSGIDLGIESSLLDQRLSIDLGYYTKTTKDLLAYVSVPSSVGGGYGITNAGSMKNSGVEFVASWKDKVNDFSYGVSMNGSTVRNKVLSLGNDNSPITSGNYHRTAVGHSVGSFYGYVQDGIFQTDQEAIDYYPSSWTSRAGDIRYKDVNGDEKIDENDRTFIGSPLPTFIYGMTVNLAYKNFDFSVDFNGVSGNKILNQKKLPSFTQFNYYNTILDRWNGESTSDFEPILNTQRGHNYLVSSNLLENGSYFRVRGLQLGYNISNRLLKKMHLEKLRVYINAQNILTFKNNSGYTPEIGGGILDGGVDRGSTYPIPTTYTGGVSLSF